MGKLSRTKGATGEREVVNILKEAGVSAKRISMMETNAIDKGDVQIIFKDVVYKGSVKRGQMIPEYFYKAIGDEHFLFTRKDKKRWMVSMDIDLFLHLLK